MSRRIGNFKDPVTGEIDWLEPDTIDKLGPILSPTNVTRAGDNYKSLIEFSLKDCEETKTIDLFAFYEIEDKKIFSDAIKIDENVFAEILADVVYSGELLDTKDEIKEAKRQAEKKLNKILLDNGIILCNLEFSGIGFINAGKDRVATIDRFKIEINKDKSVGILDDCIANAEIQNIENLKMEFYSEEYKINANIVEVLEVNESTIKHIKLEISSIELIKNNEKIEYIKYETIDQSNDYEVDSFINDRMSLLSSNLDEEMNIDLDIFDF